MKVVGCIDSKTFYVGQRMILLLYKHNNVNHRSRCIMIVAKLDVYLQRLIFMRDDLVDCCSHSIFLDPAALKMSTLRTSLFKNNRLLGSTAAGTRARSAICIGEIVYVPACGLSVTANIAGPIGLVGVWPEEFPVCRCVENIAAAENRMCH